MATTPTTNGTPASATRTSNAPAVPAGRENFGKMATMPTPSKPTDARPAEARVDVKPAAAAAAKPAAAPAKPAVDPAARAAKAKALEAAVGQI